MDNISQKPDIPADIQEKWQRIVDLISELRQVVERESNIIFKMTESEQLKSELQSYRKHLQQMVNGHSAELRECYEDLLREINKRKHLGKVLKDCKEQLALTIEATGAGIYNQKHVEELLQGSREQLRLLADYTYSWESLIGCDGKPIWVNPTVERMTGYSPIECIKMKDYPLPIIAPEDRIRMSEAFKSAFCQESAKDMEFRVQRKDGSVIWAAISWQPIYSKAGKCLGCLTIVRDITERKQAEEELRRERDKAQNYLDIVGVMILALDADQKVTLINKKGCDVLGYKENEIIGKNWFDNFLPDDIKDEVKDVYNKLMAGEIEPVEYFENPIITQDGTKRMILWHNAILKDESNHIIGVLTSGADITDRKKAEEEIKRYQEQLEELVKARTSQLEKANQQLQNEIAERVHAEEELKKAKITAEEANKAKSDFLANMSHEMRTPMNAILGYSQIMQRDTMLSKEQHRNLTIISRSGEHLLELINDVLDLSKIEAGHVTFDTGTFNLYKLLNDLETMFRLRTEEKKLEFGLEIEEGVPRYIITDENKLRQVMINLIGNAVKFTGSGGIKVRMGENGREGEKLRLWCEVVDTGAGIRKEDFERIFEAFGQTSAGKELGGTGLGLTISREYIRMMGGDITVIESELGKGSVFRFDIGVMEGTAEEGEKKKQKQRVIGLEQGEGILRILVAEDNPENRSILEELLSLVGFEVMGVTNGKEAVERWKDWNPDLIFMDIRMLEMDGLEATRRIKGTKKGRNTCIIALTAHAFKEEKEMFLKAGCDDFIRKPFNEEDIFIMVAKHLGVKYIYESIEGPQTRGEGLQGFKSEDLADLPLQWALEFRRRAIQGDIGSLVRMIGELEPDNKKISQWLLKMVNEYRFEDIIQLFQDFNGE